MKILIELNTENDEDEYKFKCFQKAESLARVLRELRNEIFRPARKHGYSKPELQILTEDQIDVIMKLEELYNNLLDEYEVNEDEL